MLRNLLTVGSWTMLSRILGLARDQLLAIFVGAGPVQDAYQIAFRLPNMFRRLFGEGAFNAAFVPLFTTIYEKEGQEKARLFAGQAFMLMLLFLGFLVILGEIFMPLLIHLIAPGFETQQKTGRLALAVTLTRITFPYMVLICLCALIAGILNGRNHFAIASAAYITFNITGITAIILAIFTGCHLSQPSAHLTALLIAHGGAWGVTVSGIVQLAVLLWAARRAGLAPRFSSPVFSANIRLLLQRMGPGLVGSGVTQLNLTVDTIISTLLPTGSISWLYFADRLNQLPLGVLGTALGTTLLPLLTRHAAAQNRKAMQDSLNHALDYALILTLPAAFGLFCLAPEIVGSLFGYGHFTDHDVRATAQSLCAYAIGLPAFVIIKLLAPGFFAEGDTTTPVCIGFLTLALNLFLNLLLYRPLAHIGPPLASAIAAFVNMFLLAGILWKRGLFRPDRHSFSRALRIVLAGSVMGVWAIELAHYQAPALWHWPALPRIAMLGFLITSSAIIYNIGLILLQIISPAQINKKLARIAGLGKKQP